MFRRMTLVTLALALMTTLAAPVAWGQGYPTEDRANVDPDGQPTSMSSSTDGTFVASLESTWYMEPTGEETHPARTQKGATDIGLHGLLDLVSQFLAQMLGF